MAENLVEIRSRRKNLHVGNRGVLDGRPVARVSYKKKNDYVTPLEFTEDVYDRPVSMMTIYFQDGSIQNEKRTF